MIHTFMSDRKLQQHAILLCAISLPLEADYYNELKLTAEGLESQKELAARRANYEWMDMIVDILEIPMKRDLWARLKFTQPFGMEFEEATGLRWAQEEFEILRQAHSFASCLASNLSWANMMFANCLPHCIAVYLHPDEWVREERGKEIADMIRCILAVEKEVFHTRLAKKPGQRGFVLPALAECLRDVGFHLFQLARYVMMLGHQTEYKLDSTEMIELAEILYGGSATTKDLLESTFAFLHAEGKQCW